MTPLPIWWANSDEGQAHSDAHEHSPVMGPEYQLELGSAQTLDLILQGFVCQLLYLLIEKPMMTRNPGRGTLNLNPRPKRKI